EFWLKRDHSIPPPPVKKMPGRPKKNKRKYKDEQNKKSKFGKDTRRGLKMSCSLCKQVGHNKKLCPTRSNMIQNLQSAIKRQITHNMEGEEKESGVSTSQCITNAESPKKKKKKTTILY
ncbi:hypothetical protein V6Z12_D05G334000, partial [Gossypium hirsutum]